MKVKIALMVFLLAFAGGGIVMAHSNMPMPEQNGQPGSTMPGMNMSGGVMQVRETPPNKKILGTFGAINLSFILIGVWYRLRGEDGSHGNS